MVSIFLVNIYLQILNVVKKSDTHMARSQMHQLVAPLEAIQSQGFSPWDQNLGELCHLSYVELDCKTWCPIEPWFLFDSCKSFGNFFFRNLHCHVVVSYLEAWDQCDLMAHIDLTLKRKYLPIGANESVTHGTLSKCLFSLHRLHEDSSLIP